MGELIGDYIAVQCDVLASNDVALRTDANVIRQTRVAARRLRSTLRVFDAALVDGSAVDLDRELVWYADLLGQVRDRDVLKRRLLDRIDALPPEHVRDRSETTFDGPSSRNATRLFSGSVPAWTANATDS